MFKNRIKDDFTRHLTNVEPRKLEEYVIKVVNEKLKEFPQVVELPYTPFSVSVGFA